MWVKTHSNIILGALWRGKECTSHCALVCASLDDVLSNPQRHQTPLLQRDVQAENGNFSTVEPRPRVNSAQGQLGSTVVAAAQGQQCFLKGGISQKALWLWSQLTAPQLTIHMEISSGRMGRKPGNFAIKQQSVTGSCCLVLVIIKS